MSFPHRTTEATSAAPHDVAAGGAQSSDYVAGNGAEALSAPVCVVGMHRSGTSLVTRLLQACGLFLGGGEELAGPALDNPEGFWENLHFVRLNEEILARMGGSWDEPPAFPARWEYGPAFEPLLEQAHELVARFSPQRRWGWKDPRNSLTIPFWRRVVPSLKVVVCVRNPLEVAHSLFVRGDATGASQFRLWLDYYRQILSAAPPSTRIVTHYQSYFEDARAEVRRVAGLLGLDASDEAAVRACANVSGALRHHRLTTDALRGAGAPEEVVELYLHLCEEAGPVCSQLMESEGRADVSCETPRHNSKDASALQLMRLDNQLAKSVERVRALEERCAGLEAELHAVRASLLPLVRALDALRAARMRLRSFVGGGRD